MFSRLRPDDRARVGTFGRAIEFSPTFTNDASALADALPRAIEPDAMTPLWRAVDQAMDLFGDAPGRRVVVVLSDGKDSGPVGLGFSRQTRYVGQLDVVDRARTDDVMIYGIGMRSRPAGSPVGRSAMDLNAMMTASLPDPGLGTAALDSGGGYLEILPRDDLGAAFARVADELHSQYLMGFTPPARDGKRHKIDVRLAAKGLKVRARKSYVAPKAGR